MEHDQKTLYQNDFYEKGAARKFRGRNETSSGSWSFFD